jgi:hypothetical protein
MEGLRAPWVLRRERSQAEIAIGPALVELLWPAASCRPWIGIAASDAARVGAGRGSGKRLNRSGLAPVTPEAATEVA